MNTRLIAVGSVVIGVAATMAGCSGSVSVGSSPVATSAADALSPQIAAALKDRGITLKTAPKVTCASGADFKPGTTVACSADLDGQPMPGSVVVGSDGSLDWTAQDAVLDLTTAQSTLGQQLAEKVPGTWNVACTPAGSATFYIAKVGGTFTCSATGTNAAGKAESATIEVTVKDVSGNVSWKVI
ncbi:MAG: DUF4333 domain-containing protein [Actinomycetes bacterium]